MDKGTLIWLIIGLVPYKIQRTCADDGTQARKVRALFWAVDVRRRASGKQDVTVRIPLIDWLRDAV